MAMLKPTRCKEAICVAKTLSFKGWPLSVISSVSADGSTSYSRSRLTSLSARPSVCSVVRERLTDTLGTAVPAACHSAMSAQTLRTTMKSSVEIMSRLSTSSITFHTGVVPYIASCQRSKASKPTIRPVLTSTCGWYSG